MAGESFASPVGDLISTPPVGTLAVAPQPTGGQGLALDPTGHFAASLIKGYPNNTSTFLRGDGAWASSAGSELALAVLSNSAQQTIAITGTETSPTDVISVTYTANGTDSIIVEGIIGAVQWTTGFAVGDFIGVNLWFDGSDTGRLWADQVQQTTAVYTEVGVLLRSGQFAPAAGSHTLKFRGWKTGSGTYNIFYQDGGIGNTAAQHNPAITIRILKVI